MKVTQLGGPMFEPEAHGPFRSILGKRGGHYNIFAIDDDGNNRISESAGMVALKQIFPEGEANDMNLCLFSTSGIHGSYTTIEDLETSLTKYGDDPGFSYDDDSPDDWEGNSLTVLIIQPRIVCLRYGQVQVSLDDIPYLKKLRASSGREFAKLAGTLEEE